jgi:hypothetical protein
MSSAISHNATVFPAESYHAKVPLNIYKNLDPFIEIAPLNENDLQELMDMDIDTYDRTETETRSYATLGKYNDIWIEYAGNRLKWMDFQYVQNWKDAQDRMNTPNFNDWFAKFLENWSLSKQKKVCK